MAIAKVRDGGTTNVTGATGPISVPAAGHALGNTVYVAVAVNGGTCTGVTDSKGNTYTQAATSAGELTFWASKLTTALVSGDIITVTLAGSAGIAAASAEFSEVSKTVDKTTNKLDGTGSFNPTTTTTAVTSVADELVFAVFLTGGTIGSFSAAGYTNLVIPQNGVACAWGYKIVSATGAQACTATIDQFLPYRAIAATFPREVVAPPAGGAKKDAPGIGADGLWVPDQKETRIEELDG
jgi:hypothetical protein